MKSFEDALAEGIAAIQAAVNPYEAAMTEAAAAGEPGPPPPDTQVTAPADDQ